VLAYCPLTSIKVFENRDELCGVGVLDGVVNVGSAELEGSSCASEVDGEKVMSLAILCEPVGYLGPVPSGNGT
jgi:hypothetical protein